MPGRNLTSPSALLWLLIMPPPTLGWGAGSGGGGGFGFPRASFQGVSATRSLHSSPQQPHTKFCSLPGSHAAPQPGGEGPSGSSWPSPCTPVKAGQGKGGKSSEPLPAGQPHHLTVYFLLKLHHVPDLNAPGQFPRGRQEHVSLLWACPQYLGLSLTSRVLDLQVGRHSSLGFSSPRRPTGSPGLRTLLA